MQRERAARPPPSTRLNRRCYLMALPTLLNLLEAFWPRTVTAPMQTTAIRATRRAYSTSEAPRSVLQRDCSQALTNSYEVSMVGSPFVGSSPNRRAPDRPLVPGIIDPGRGIYMSQKNH